MKRIARGVGALLGLLLGLVGVPLALVLAGGDLWPRSWAPAEIVRVLLQPDDGRLLIGLLTFVGWIAWAVFALSVVAELIGLLSHRRRLRIPGLGAPQRLAAALLIAVIALVPVAPTAHADPGSASASSEPAPSQASPPDDQQSVTPPSTAGLPGPGGRATSPGARAPGTEDSGAASPVAGAESHAAKPRAAGPSASTTPATDATRAATQGGAAITPGRAASKEPAITVHRVAEGDDLWSLAEHYYGNGLEWRKIAKANGHVLTGGPDRLEPGWKLTIPGVATPSQDERTVTVHRGDTLSSIAEDELDSASRWPDVFRANRAVLDDPDELAVGTSLVIPRDEHAQQTATESARRTDAKPAPQPLEQQVPDPSQPERQASAGSDTDRSDQPEAEKTEPARPAAGSSAAGAPSTAPAQPGAPATPAQPAATVTAPAQSGAPSTAPAQSGAPTTAPAQSGAPTTAPAQSGAPTTAADRPSDEDPATAQPDPESEAAVSISVVAGVGGLLAAGLVGGLAYRRRLQLQARPVGRRILHAPPETARAEAELGVTERPLDLETVDIAFRAIATHCRRSGDPVPVLSTATLEAGSLVLTLDGAHGEPPLGFRTHRTGWSVDQADARYLASLPGLDDAMRPYPAVVELGHETPDRRLLVNLEELGLLSLSGDAAGAHELLSAMAVELAFVPAADEMILTLVGDESGLTEALDKHNVTTTTDVDGLLDRLESRALAQREQRLEGPAGHFRIDPDLSDPWAPEVIMIHRPLSPDQQHRLVSLVSSRPRPTIAVICVGDISDAPWKLRLGLERATLEPAGRVLIPQRLRPASEEALVSLIATTGSLETTPAPWWADDSEPPDPPPDNVAYLARRSAGWGTDHDDENGRDMAHTTVIGRDEPPDHPVLMLLGPIDLLGAQGPLPPRAAKQCLEYCGWLLEHPGTTAQAMGTALLVAEGTRRSNMSRLRAWLGAGPDGEAYLPDAYSGRIMLHAAVSSDWHRLQILTSAGVNRTSDAGLQSALQLVRGAPLADAAPGQWSWAEELRIDMISVVRDIGVELANRANEARELDLARWAAARALAAAPGDELLMATRIRTEHLAGNRMDTERLTLQLAAQSRTLGVDLNPETVDLLQQVMEGQVRARLA